jgi:ankyrin repeat protein
MGINGFDADLFDAAEFGDLDWVRSAFGSVGVDGQPINIDARNTRGETILMLASYYGHIEIVRFLLKKGANPNLRDERGQSALDRAKAGNHSDAAVALSKYNRRSLGG